MALLAYSVPVSALSTAYSYDESAFDRLDAEYIADMEEMGFTVEKIKALSYWNKKVVNARSVQELETLLIEYKDLVEGTMVDISNSVDSFTSHYLTKNDKNATHRNSVGGA